ncbi:hypothetical protein F5X97DRAFT_304888 [Nemania serpens]|nr:hypothetical protein F5X97DRAFT_304888 [Nemania serpens]
MNVLLVTPTYSLRDFSYAAEIGVLAGISVATNVIRHPVLARKLILPRMLRPPSQMRCSPYCSKRRQASCSLMVPMRKYMSSVWFHSCIHRFQIVGYRVTCVAASTITRRQGAWGLNPIGSSLFLCFFFSFSYISPGGGSQHQHLHRESIMYKGIRTYIRTEPSLFALEAVYIHSLIRLYPLLCRIYNGAPQG